MAINLLASVDGAPEAHSNSVLDYIVVISITLASVPFVLANIIIIINRDCKPVKTRNVSLTVMSSMGGLIWLGATIVVNDHFVRREKTFWTICPLWTFWLQACFGFALWLNCMTLHLIRLYTLLILKLNLDKRDNIKWITTRLLLLLSPTIILCACATFFHAIRFEPFNVEDPLNIERAVHRAGTCKIHKKDFSALLITLLPLYFIIFIGFAFKLRNIMAQFNEFRQIRNGGIMSLFLFLLSLVTLQTDLYTKVPGRCFLASSVAGAVFYYFWARNGEIVFNVLFNKKKYEQQFLEDLTRSSYVSSDLHCDSMRRNTQHMLRELNEETFKFETEISQLAEQNKTLKESIQNLQNQVAKSKSLCWEATKEEIQASKRDMANNVERLSEIYLISLPVEKIEIFEGSTS